MSVTLPAWHPPRGTGDKGWETKGGEMGSNAMMHWWGYPWHGLFTIGNVCGFELTGAFSKLDLQGWAGLR